MVPYWHLRPIACACRNVSTLILSKPAPRKGEIFVARNIFFIQWMRKGYRWFSARNSILPQKRKFHIGRYFISAVRYRFGEVVGVNVNNIEILQQFCKSEVD